MFECKLCNFKSSKRKTIRTHIKTAHHAEIRELCKQNRELKAEMEKSDRKDRDEIKLNGIGTLIKKE